MSRSIAIVRALLVSGVTAIILTACGGGGGDSGGVPVTPTPTPNLAPTATNAAIVTRVGTIGSVAPSVTDPNAGDVHTFSIESNPTNGTVATSTGNAVLTYQPKAGFNGTDSFTYRATDRGGLSVVGTASVTVVNNPPTSVSATITTTQGTLITTVTTVVTDLDNDTHQFSIVSQPAHGLAKLSGNQLTYQADLVYSGADNFTLRATDAGGLFVDGTATVSITAVNLAPLATRARFPVYAVNPANGGSPLVSATDVFDSFTTDISGSAPTRGVVTTTGTTFNFTTASPVFTGVDSFTYAIADSNKQTVIGTALVKIYNATNYARCTTPSTVILDSTTLDTTFGVRVNSFPCAVYGEVVTRQDVNGIPVSVKYIALRPSSGIAAKAAVVVIAGGALTANLSGDVTTGAVTAAGGNYVVRSAQLLADGGYLVVVIDRPSDREQGVVGLTDPAAYIDSYRVSVDHTTDILKVLQETNTDALPVFLSGTSRGAISVVANNLIANHIELSSAVTVDNAPNHLYVGAVNPANLQLSSIKRSTHILLHASDLCPLSLPDGSRQLYTNLNNLLVPTTKYEATGGVRVSKASVVNGTTINPDFCGAFDYHGFMGIEPTVMSDTIARLDGVIQSLFTSKNNRHPVAAHTAVNATAGASRPIDLALLVRDLDANTTLSYDLPHTVTGLGGSVTRIGSTVTYTPPAGITNATDYFPYVVSDNNGGVGAAVIQVQISN